MWHLLSDLNVIFYSLKQFSLKSNHEWELNSWTSTSAYWLNACKLLGTCGELGHNNVERTLWALLILTAAMYEPTVRYNKWGPRLDSRQYQIFFLCPMRCPISLLPGLTLSRKLVVSPLVSTLPYTAELILWLILTVVHNLAYHEFEVSQ